ncbi:hypothetical protein AMP1_13 [Burkholderia phage AMP1]|uniref:Uncharacterized protein n=5 Tax=Ampunavirus BpAMP1 TaxID=2733589 RepID=A0A5C2IH53_9CAUD|nr:hypothetical protein HOQ94_gp16 [Burkholderia phage Bp-AMP1]QEP52840.1 hypothetical protein AMP1_13 [Burkholderia phage AMP1]CDL65171.1 hypothetical protein [Burkholderia phage Bp-AMP2]CDL65211.1 hypothetical protein [Burkholderia phage Bp-AMP3]CDL65259.1 hypothetical protein [Burkholderia phage Bp-AMP4]CDK30085.1 hypothetical protein [Burkholderia phage Bp-AMP1]
MKEILSLTRKAHELAVRLHVAALRVQVRVIRAEAEAARESARIASAAAVKARHIANDAVVQADAYDQHADHVEQLARLEASSIGGRI